MNRRLAYAFAIACSIAFWISLSGCCGILQLDHC